MLVVGLGNPGRRYAGSPHNAGFRVLDRFVDARLGEARVGWAERFEAEVVVACLAAEQLVLLKPLTFMNRSGESVRKAMTFFEISERSTLIVHDELDLPIGAIKLKQGGGEAGHNGLKSVSAELGTREYCRLRVGVGRPPSGEVAEFLLTPLVGEAAAQLDACLEGAGEAIDLWVRCGIERAMNLVNRQVAGPAKPEAGRPD